MKCEEITNKAVTLLVMGKDSQGERDWAVVKGSIVQSGTELLFVHEGKPDGFPLPDDALDRIKPTTPETKGILLGADLCLSLTIGPIPERTDSEGITPTGLGWPE